MQDFGVQKVSINYFQTLKYLQFLNYVDTQFYKKINLVN
jgi:hypothetical protein